MPESLAALAPAEMRQTLHELRVHQIELELQNEELRRAQVELDTARARYFDLYDLAPVGYVTLSEQGAILEANLTAATLLGGARGALVQHPFSQFLLREDEDFYYLRQKQLFKTGKPQSFELRLVKKDGTDFWAQLEATATQDAVGAPVCRLVLSDITDRKQAEAALALAKAELDHQNQTLEQTVNERTAQLRETIGDLEHFSYSITHDLRAPLRAMRSFASLLLEECGSVLAPAPRGYLQRIATAADRLDRLIVDALDYSKAVRQELPLVPVDAEGLLRGMLETYPGWQLPQAQIQIDGQLPQVLASEAGLTQCFSNLLDNAVKFVAPGTGPQVRVWAERREPLVRLWFQDNGIGIPAASQDFIFGMFQQLSRKYEGTGIGLALVRKVARRMQGQVGVESEPGRGSRFWLDLRLAR